MRVKKQFPFSTWFVLSIFATHDGSFSNAFLVRDTETKFYKSSRQCLPFASTSTLVRLNGDNNNDNDGGGIQEELERLQDQLQYIEAIESRNEAQLDSFVDEEDQWNSMEEEERELLKSKEAIQQKMELLTEQLVMLWMGQKSQDG